VSEFLGDTRLILGATESDMVKMEQRQNDLLRGQEIRCN
jgi:hypothetical protein